MNADARMLALVLLVAFAPAALVLLVAMLRGYTIHLHMRREHHRRIEDDQ